MRLKHLAVLLVITTQTMAQSNRLSFDWKSGPQVIISNDTLEHAFMGGIDLPQFSRVDLNLDGTEDLVIGPLLVQMRIIFLMKMILLKFSLVIILIHYHLNQQEFVELLIMEN